MGEVAQDRDTYLTQGLAILAARVRGQDRGALHYACGGRCCVAVSCVGVSVL